MGTLAEPIGAGDRRQSERWTVAQWSFVISAILVVAAWLRLHDLDRTSLWEDEAFSWYQSRGSLLNLIHATAQDNYPPLHNLVLWVMMKLVGDSEIALRLPSALFGIVNVYVLYRLGALLWDRLTGCLAALLLTFSALHIWYSQEARMYSLLALTSTLFILATMRLVLEPRRSRAVLAGVAGVLLLYSHVYGTFLWASINAAVLLRVRTRARPGVAVDCKTWLIPQMVAAALFLPWAVVLVGRIPAAAILRFLPEPTASNVLYQFRDLAGGSGALIGLAFLSMLSIVDLGRADTGRAGTAAGQFRLRMSLHCDWRHSLLLTWLTAPALIGYLLSIATHPILFFRYLICSLPALFLLAAWGLRRLALNGTLTAIVVLATVAVSFATAPEPASDGLMIGDRYLVRHEDYRRAAEIFARESRPSDHLIFGRRTLAFHYYVRVPMQFELIVRGAVIPDDILEKNDRLWIIALPLYDTKDLLDLLVRARAKYSEMAEHQPSGIVMFLFTRAAPKS